MICTFPHPAVTPTIPELSGLRPRFSGQYYTSVKKVMLEATY